MTTALKTDFIADQLFPPLTQASGLLVLPQLFWGSPVSDCAVTSSDHPCSTSGSALTLTAASRGESVRALGALWVWRVLPSCTQLISMQGAPAATSPLNWGSAFKSPAPLAPPPCRALGSPGASVSVFSAARKEGRWEGGRQAAAPAAPSLPSRPEQAGRARSHSLPACPGALARSPARHRLCEPRHFRIPECLRFPAPLPALLERFAEVARSPGRGGLGGGCSSGGSSGGEGCEPGSSPGQTVRVTVPAEEARRTAKRAHPEVARRPRPGAPRCSASRRSVACGASMARDPAASRESAASRAGGAAEGLQ